MRLPDREDFKSPDIPRRCRRITFPATPYRARGSRYRIIHDISAQPNGVTRLIRACVDNPRKFTIPCKHKQSRRTPQAESCTAVSRFPRTARTPQISNSRDRSCHRSAIIDRAREILRRRFSSFSEATQRTIGIGKRVFEERSSRQSRDALAK